MNLRERIDKVIHLKNQIESYGKLSDALLNKINYKFRLDWNYYSNSMEGNTLTINETRSIMIGNVTLEGKPLRDILEMKGHDDVVQNILRIGKGEMNISESKIKELHKAIMHEEDAEKKLEIGRWKQRENEIINYKNEKFEFSKPSAVIEEMHQLVNWLNAEGDKINKEKTINPAAAILAFEFHLRYLTIHPFYDGNGRTARILMNLILISYGFPPVIIKPEDKKSYYQYLADVQCYGASTDFYVGFMLGLLARSMELVLNVIIGKEIEDEDDLDKEIELLKISLANNSIVTEKKSKENIYKAIGETIAPFMLFVRDQLKPFNDFFNEGNIILVIQSESISHSFPFYKPSSNYEPISTEQLYAFIQEHQPKNEYIYHLECICTWNGFKYNKNQPYDADTSFKISFDPYHYIFNKNLSSNKLPEIKKLYGERLTEEEQNKLIKSIKKQILVRIKELSD